MSAPPEVPANLAEAWNACPYHSLLGRDIPPDLSTPGALDAVLSRVRCAVAIMGSSACDPIESGALAELVTILRQGGTVAIMSDNREQRDHMKREVCLAWSAPAGAA